MGLNSAFKGLNKAYSLPLFPTNGQLANTSLIDSAYVVGNV